eukprot:6200462-Pleurochrysis_carterae.AAC.2
MSHALLDHSMMRAFVIDYFCLTLPGSPGRRRAALAAPMRIYAMPSIRSCTQGSSTGFLCTRKPAVLARSNSTTFWTDAFVFKLGKGGGKEMRTDRERDLISRAQTAFCVASFVTCLRRLSAVHACVSAPGCPE